MDVFLVLLIALVAAAIGFFAGRASIPDPVAGPATPAETTVSESPVTPSPVSDRARGNDPRVELLRALEQPAAARSHAVRRAMIAWLTVDGAAAIVAARDDPELSGVADRMTHLALHAYPELLLHDPSLLEAVQDTDLLIASAAYSLGRFEPELVRTLVDRHLSGSMIGSTLLATVDQMHRFGSGTQSAEDVQAELESIRAEENVARRLSRLHMLINQVASSDPAAAAELIDELPGSSGRRVTHRLIEAWARTDPEEAARWLVGRDAESLRQLPLVAWMWGMRDFDAASAFADTLTGAGRVHFLEGLARSTSHMSTGETLAWMSRYEGQTVYPELVQNVVRDLAEKDTQAALALAAGLSDEARFAAYRYIVPKIARKDPQAAIAMIPDVENNVMSGRLAPSLAPMICSVWARNDAESALEWASGLQRGPERDHAIASVTSSLAQIDVDRAIDAINEIDDPELRRSPVMGLLMLLETDDEAIRLGQDYDFDRDQVLQLRERGRRGPGAVTERVMVRRFGFDLKPGADGEPAP